MAFRATKVGVLICRLLSDRNGYASLGHGVTVAALIAAIYSGLLLFPDDLYVALLALNAAIRNAF